MSAFGGKADIDRKCGHVRYCSPIMRPLSSKMTFYYKRVSPVIFFGVVLLMFGFGLISVLRERKVSNVPFLIVLLLLAVFAYRFVQKLVFNLAEEVLDAGSALVVRSGGQEERIALSDIKNVNYSPYMSPPQVTLSVRRHTVFGETIAFLDARRRPQAALQKVSLDVCFWHKADFAALLSDVRFRACSVPTRWIEWAARCPLCPHKRT